MEWYLNGDLKVVAALTQEGGILVETIGLLIGLSVTEVKLPITGQPRYDGSGLVTLKAAGEKRSSGQETAAPEWRHHCLPLVPVEWRLSTGLIMANWPCVKKFKNLYKILHSLIVFLREINKIWDYQ